MFLQVCTTAQMRRAVHNDMLVLIVNVPLLQDSELDHQIHVIEVPCSLESSVIQQKPPDYETVADAPPCYEDAIKLSPSLLLATINDGNSNSDQSQPSTPSTSAPSSATSITAGVEISSETSSNSGPASARRISRLQQVAVNRSGVPCTPPPPYVATR